MLQSLRRGDTKRCCEPIAFEAQPFNEGLRRLVLEAVAESAAVRRHGALPVLPRTSGLEIAQVRVGAPAQRIGARLQSIEPRLPARAKQQLAQVAARRFVVQLRPQQSDDVIARGPVVAGREHDGELRQAFGQQRLSARRLQQSGRAEEPEAEPLHARDLPLSSRRYDAAKGSKESA